MKKSVSKPRKKLDKRPWGSEEIFTLNEKSSVKILHLSPGKRFSLQNHKNRGEFWKVLKGPVKITLGNKEIKAKEGDEFFVPIGKKHRAQAYSKPASLLEISFGKFEERDIKRFEDDFGRL